MKQCRKSGILTDAYVFKGNGYQKEVCKAFYRSGEYSGRFYTPIPEIGNRRSDVKETALPF